MSETEHGKIRIPADEYAKVKEAVIAEFEKQGYKPYPICPHMLMLKFNGTLITLDDKKKDVHWHVEWCSSTDYVYNHPITIALFDALRAIVYVRGKGGTIYGSNSKTKEYIVEEFKPVVCGERFSTRGGNF